MFRCGKNILKQRENHSQHDNNLTSDQKTRSKSKRSTAGESARQRIPRENANALTFLKIHFTFIQLSQNCMLRNIFIKTLTKQKYQN